MKCFAIYFLNRVMIIRLPSRTTRPSPSLHAKLILSFSGDAMRFASSAVLSSSDLDRVFIPNALSEFARPRQTCRAERPRRQRLREETDAVVDNGDHGAASINPWISGLVLSSPGSLGKPEVGREHVTHHFARQVEPRLVTTLPLRHDRENAPASWNRSQGFRPHARSRAP